MTERTTVEFTQAGKRITFSAGYITSVSAFGMHTSGLDGKQIHFKSALITQLGVVFVDQDYREAMERWNTATNIPDPSAPVPSRPLGNEAEF